MTAKVLLLFIVFAIDPFLGINNADEYSLSFQQ
ncbi:uncharacterized protein METZ01_LOCUS271427, partial [marine metagenome]